MTDSDVRTQVSLAQAVDEGILRCTLVAARKAAQRPGFPAPTATLGPARLYDIGALRAYQAKKETPVPVSGQPAETWKPIPGVIWWYQASDRGRIRSLDHKDRNGHFHEGQVLNPRTDGDGYLVVNVTLDSGERKHGVPVARLVLLAHAGKPDDPELQACHGPGGQRDNRWPENLRWDTDEANRADWRRDNPPKPKPLKLCPRCGAEHAEKGRNCRACFEGLGVQGARLLADGTPLEKAADQLGYPPVALVNLAVRYGGLRFVIEDEINAALRATGHGESPKRRLRRVLFRRGASRQNSDAQ